MVKSVYDIIKKQNGEAFAKAIRDYDSGIFEIENLPHIVRYAGRNALPLLGFLRSLKKVDETEEKTNKTPFQLLQTAGYDAFYADSLEKQNSIKKYFAKGEDLCTFRDPERFLNYHIIHCIKKGAEKLNRSDFKGKEAREDEYGTSVISIQISKNGKLIKICNRYNHTVDCPDNTFDSNPDRIIEGLSSALKTHFNISFKHLKVSLNLDYTYQNGQIFKFVDEMNNVYYGEEFYLKNGVVYPIKKDYQLMANEFLIDFKNKKVVSVTGTRSSFLSILMNELSGDVLSVRKQEGKTFVFSGEKEILCVKEGVIKRLSLYKTTRVEDFLIGDFDLEEFYGHSIEEISGDSFVNCGSLKKVVLPHCERISQDSFSRSKCSIEAPKMEEMGFFFLGGGVAFSPYFKGFYLKGGLTSALYKFLNKQASYYEHFEVKKEETGHLIIADGKPFLRFKNNQLVGIYLHKGAWKIDSFIINNLDYLEEFESTKTTMVEQHNFSECLRLKSIHLPKVNVIFPGNTFRDLKSLEEVDLSSLKTNQYADQILFLNCPNLKRVYAPCLELNENLGVFYMKGKALEGCNQLEDFEAKNGTGVQKPKAMRARSMIYDYLLSVKKERGSYE